MGSELVRLSLSEFESRLAPFAPAGLPRVVFEQLFVYYQELRRWNRRTSLVGRGTTEKVVERHFGESLAGLELLSGATRRLVDLGSGAGFPGAILAAARTDITVLLVESRARKASFLRHAVAKAALPCQILDARVGAALPSGFPHRIDFLTSRAVRFDSETWTALAGRLSRGGEALIWGGYEPVGELADWTTTRRLRLPGRDRWIVALGPPNGTR